MKAETDSQKKGLTLSELVVITSVALVMAAILLPAIAGQNPERAETILNSADTMVVFDGIVPSRSRVNSNANRYDNRIQAAKRMEMEESHRESGQSQPAAVVAEKMLTTDIRSRRP